ncbi:hypothetical protein PI95_013955 [Hassallia byssoidea VB512170]|uniref:Uncharacterized protein n=1 Tax=Hassallia byssoidea VB512170 TaxID=1304833 RepID=A0A846H985_9CYAN|nr:hypothetical protein [Hassalia byssoidea]NEU73633.1 hypothetical protein [Hassalia byssoidea VB512170]
MAKSYLGQLTTNNQQPTTNNYQLTTINQQPTTNKLKENQKCAMALIE